MAHEPQQPASNSSAGDTVTLPVQREEIEVGKRTVDTGRGVRLSRQVTEHPQRVEQQLWHDELEVRRVTIDTVVAAGTPPPVRYEGDTLVVPVLEEILFVEKRYRIKEELHITRTRRQQTHVETVVLKSEELSVERFDYSADRQKPDAQ